MVPNAEEMRKAAAAGFSTATDLADWLVRTLKMPFREAHHVTGSLVALAETEGCDLPELPLTLMQSVEPRITQGRLQGADRRKLGRLAHELRRHGTEECAREAKRWLKLLKA